MVGVRVVRSVAGGDGAFLEFKKYGTINISGMELRDCENSGGNGILNMGYNVVVNLRNSSFANTITQRGTVTFTNNNEINIEDCQFFNVSAQYGGHLRIRKNNVGNFRNINFTKGEALMGGVAEIDFDDVITMENIAVREGGGYVGGSFLYLEQNITLVIKGTQYCDVSDLYASAAFFIGTEDVRVNVSNCYFHNVSSPVGTIVYSANLGNSLLENITIKDSFATAGGAFNLIVDSNLTLRNIKAVNCSCLK